MAFMTGNALGSSDVRDLKDNAVNLDWFANGPAASYPDRFGTARKSVAQMNAEYLAAQVARANEFIATQNAKQAVFDASQADRVYQFKELLKNSAYEVPVDYVAGIGITRPTQTVRYAGELYRGKDASLPFTTTTWAADSGKFFAIGDAALRQELAAPSGSRKSGHLRSWNTEKIHDTGGMLDVQPINPWEYADLAIGYVAGGDPLAWDWSPALQAAANAVFSKSQVTGQYCSNLPHSGLVLDLGGRALRLKSPIVTPTGSGVTIQNGMLFADATFPTNRFLWEMGDGTGFFRHENVKFVNMVFDARHLGGCVSWRNSIRCRMIDCHIMRYSLDGVKTNGLGSNFELMISGCTFGYRSALNTDRDAGSVSTGYGINFSSTDNRVVNCVFNTSNSIICQSQAQRIVGCQFYGDYSTPSITIKTSLVNVSDCDFGKNGIAMYSPYNNSVTGNRFVLESMLSTEYAMVLIPVAAGETMSGVVITGNTFNRNSGVRSRAIAYSTAQGTITHVKGSVITDNGFFGVDATATRARKSQYITVVKTATFDFSDVILFGAPVFAAPSFANQGATDLSIGIAGNMASVAINSITARLSANGTGNVMMELSVEEAA